VRLRAADREALIDRYAFLRGEIGENPAEFLTKPDLDVNSVRPHESLAFVRIRGIDFLDVLRWWIKIESDIGPRPTVMTWLRDRNQALITHGERDARTTRLPDPDPDEIPTLPAVFVDENGEPYERNSVTYGKKRLTARRSGRSVAKTSKPKQATLVADGGDQQ
jgi:hypothetical protein